MIFRAIEQFWSHHPALLYGLVGVLGFMMALQAPLVPLIMIGIFAIVYLLRGNQRMLFAIGVFGAMFLLTKVAYRMPEVPSEGIQGTIHFDISAVSSSMNHFGPQWTLQGRAKTFTPDLSDQRESYGKNFFCLIRIPKRKNLTRPPADRSYLVRGTLKQSKIGSYYFVVKKDAPWDPVSGSWSLAEWRFRLKQGIRKYVYQHIPNKQSAEFLTGIVTGEFEDRLMRAEFGKMGLQHIMAISGFHFALIASFLSIMLRWVLRPKMAVGLLIFLLSSYYFALGGSASISRAWIMSLIVLCGVFSEKRTYALNSLGVAILFILFTEPMLCRTLGFQFSVLTTASILLFYSVVKNGLENVMLRRSLGQMASMSVVDQHFYCILTVMKEALALAIAVNLTALPITLYYFHKFPLLSLVFNLFIPFLVSISMFLFLITTVVYCIVPPIGSALYALNSHLVNHMLNYIYHVPASLQYSWRIAEFPTAGLVIHLCLIFLLGIFWRHKLDQEARWFQQC